jgi:hypothetical protein
MTDKVNFSKKRYTSVKTKALPIYLIAMSTLIAITSIVTFASEHSVNAQVTMGYSDGNMASGLHELQQKVIANGTIDLEQTILKAIGSKVKTSLTQAMITAERSVGNNSFAVAGFGGEYSGYFAYQIILGTPGMEFYIVLVDPGNGHILATQKVSAAELVKMHQEHSAEVIRSGSAGDIGFPFLIPH